MNSAKLVLAFASVSLFIGCSEIDLAAVKAPPIQAESLGTFCTKNPDDIQRFTKFLFVMDKSGSNNTTDPGAEKRAGGFEKFYEKNKNNPSIKWGMIQFGAQSGQAGPLIAGPDGEAVFTDDESLVREGVDKLRGGDNGNTPYDQALALTADVIRQDKDKYPNEYSIYMVIFLSDGEPTSPQLPGGYQPIMDATKRIVEIDEGRIFVSTGFYGSSVDGKNLLRDMAEKVGGGIYRDLSQDDEFNFDDLVVEPGREPWIFKNMIVYNLSSAICEDQRYDMDSDNDGVCDKDEVKYGLNPQKRHSKSDGYSDYFHWLIATKQLSNGDLGTCPEAKRVDNDMDMLNDCEEKVLKNSRPIGTKKTTSNPIDPDTDNDGVLDSLEAIIYRNILGAPMNGNDALTDFDREGLSAYLQIFEHRNPRVPDMNAAKYDTTIEFSHYSDSGQACYTFNQKNLQLYRTLPVAREGDAPYLSGHDANENKVLVYFFQVRSTNPTGKGIYNYSYQTLTADTFGTPNIGTTKGLKINDSVFSSYIVPEEEN